MTPPLRLAVALDGAGLFDPRSWAGLLTEAERGLVDFVTFEDSLDGTDGDRLDAVLLASRMAPVTTRIGLVPVVTIAHTEPFHLATSLATLDHISGGRAGCQIRLSLRATEAAQFGRRDVSARTPQDVVDEAADVVEVVRRLWDSWEDDAEIRDAATGRFIDRDKLHHVDFEGHWFKIKGPLITPRPPQGQPLVTVQAEDSLTQDFAVRHADVAFTTPRSREEATALVERMPGVRVFADLAVSFGDGGHTPSGLADLLTDWRQAGLTGFRLRPLALPADLLGITRELIPELRARGAFRRDDEATTLRGLLGLGRPANRYIAGSRS